MKLARMAGTALALCSAVAMADMPAGDAERGRVVFGSCRTCHWPEKGAGHQNGPALWNIFGRRAGTQEGFAYYSESLKQSGIVWSPEYLDAWLANPATFIPGTTMMTLGVPESKVRVVAPDVGGGFGARDMPEASIYRRFMPDIVQLSAAPVLPV